MATVADAFRRHAPAYVKQFGDSIPLGHRKVIQAITRCRTGELGHVLLRCNDCGNEHWAGRSCGNRHCPNCQKQKTQRWLDQQTAKLLPVHHFLVTFTVPEELRRVLRAHQRDGYTAIFNAGSETIRDLGASSKYLAGCQLGYFGVLHTWGRDPMIYHPHVHFVVPGGGLNHAEGRWQSTPENFLFPHAAMCLVYKAKFADAMRGCGLHDLIPATAWQGKWTVDIQPVGDGQAVLKYLAPYVHRVAISDHRIVACNETHVTYRIKPTGKQQWKTRQVTGCEFVRGFVQHTLPPRLQKIRYYGWMSPNSAASLDELRWLVSLFLGWCYILTASAKQRTEKSSRCDRCGGELQCVLVTNHEGRVLHANALPYLDSG